VVVVSLGTNERRKDIQLMAAEKVQSFEKNI